MKYLLPLIFSLVFVSVGLGQYLISPINIARMKNENLKKISSEVKYFIKDGFNISYWQIQRDGIIKQLPLLKTFRNYGNSGIPSVFEGVSGIDYTDQGFVVTKHFKADSILEVISAIASIQDKLQVSNYSNKEEWVEGFSEVLTTKKTGSKTLLDNFVFELPILRSQVFDTTGVVYLDYRSILEGQRQYHAILDSKTNSGVFQEDNQYWGKLNPSFMFWARSENEYINIDNLRVLLICSFDVGSNKSHSNIKSHNSSLLLSVVIKEYIVYDITNGMVYGRAHI